MAAVVEIRVSVAAFGEALGAMRSWLDGNKCGPVKFETASEPPAAILVRLEFEESGPAAAFERQFGDIRLSQAA